MKTLSCPSTPRLWTALLIIWTGCTASGCATNTNTVPAADKGRPPTDTSLHDHRSQDQLSDVSYTGGFARQPGYSTASLEVAGHTRKVEVYAPAKLGLNRPLLVTFHGTNDDALNMIKGRTHANVLADDEDLLVVSPWARHLQSGDWDNHTGSEKYWETYPNTDPDKNADLLLLRAIIQEAHAVYKTDPKRVFLLGHSSGGFFAVAGALALPGMIAGFVSNAAGLVRCPRTGGCTFKGRGTNCSGFGGQPGYCACGGVEKPAAVPPAAGGAIFGYISHANDDNIVSVYYSCELAARMKAQGHPLSLNIWPEGGHTVPLGLVRKAWPALKTHALP